MILTPLKLYAKLTRICVDKLRLRAQMDSITLNTKQDHQEPIMNTQLYTLLAKQIGSAETQELVNLMHIFKQIRHRARRRHFPC